MLAQVSDVISGIDSAILSPLIVLLFAAALVYFLWGVYIFIQNADALDKREEGRRHMIYGVIGIVIMVGVKSIIDILLNTFDI